MARDPSLRGGPPLVTPASANPVLDQTTQAFLDAVAAAGAPPFETLSPVEARAAFAALQAGPVTGPDAVIEDRVLPVGPTGAIAVRIVRPVGAAPPSPVILYFHGGGWVAGGPHTHDRLIRELAVGADAALVFVDYSLAPEVSYPVQNEQAYAAMLWIVENAAGLGLDAHRLAVAGDGAGGNMAAALTLMAKSRRGPEIAFQLLFYPVVADISDGGSYGAFEDGPWLTLPVAHFFRDAQFPDPESRRQITAFPLIGRICDLENLPPALVITPENDILRDEGEAYGRKLMQAGVAVVSTRYNGAIHDFVVLDGLAETPSARAAVAQAIAALRSALHP